jgi:hypothetical protein
MANRRIGNLHVIALVDKIGKERIYSVECVCGTRGKITETGLYNRVSCGCSSVVRPHRLGLRIASYTFTRFVGEHDGRHMYAIRCEACGGRNVVSHRYSRSRCPSCPRIIQVRGRQIDLTAEARRIGIHENALRQRLQRMPITRALSMPRTKRGGHKGCHGVVSYRGVIDTIPGHLERLDALSRKGAVYYWIRKGLAPIDALDRCIDTPEGLQILLELFPAPKSRVAC